MQLLLTSWWAQLAFQPGLMLCCLEKGISRSGAAVGLPGSMGSVHGQSQVGEGCAGHAGFPLKGTTSEWRSWRGAQCWGGWAVRCCLEKYVEILCLNGMRFPFSTWPLEIWGEGKMEKDFGQKEENGTFPWWLLPAASVQLHPGAPSCGGFQQCTGVGQKHKGAEFRWCFGAWIAMQGCTEVCRGCRAEPSLGLCEDSVNSSLCHKTNTESVI